MWTHENRPNEISTPFLGSVTKEHLGQCTWTFLHTLAAQYPERPTRRQKHDTRQLVSVLPGVPTVRIKMSWLYLTVSLLCR